MKKNMHAAGVLQLLCDRLDPTMPLRTALVFVTIAARCREGERPEQAEIGEALGMPSGLLSRDVGILSKYSRGTSGGGLDVVENIIDPQDRRRRRLRLTNKGAKLAEEVFA